MKEWVQDSKSRSLSRQLPKYRILAQVGQGQFGQVFCAVERQSGQLVALKEITHRRSSTSKFLRELGSLLTLQHPNIVTCRAFEATTTARYLVMDYCEGGTLRDLLEAEDSLSLGEALTIMQGILAGLEQAHRDGIIHCDIKPENILLGLDAGMWLPRLSDFGIARRLSEIDQNRATVESAEGSIDVVGAPAYTSPEAFYGMYSRSSDIYAMGIVFFELLLGHRPFTGIPERLMWAHLNQPLEIPSVVPEPLQAILTKALAKLKGRRYGTAAEMSEAIAQVMNHPEISPLMTKPLPFRPAYPVDPDHDVVLTPQMPDILIVSQQELPGALTGLVSGNGYLYGIFQQNTVLIWRPGETEAVPISFPEPVSEIIPLANSCLVGVCEDLGGGSIYWASPKSRQPKRLLKLKQRFTLSADPDSKFLAVAVSSQSGKKAVRFGFYSLGSECDGVKPPQLKLLKSFTLAAAMLPQLMFLDRRHLLTIWHSRDAKKSQTIFKLYSRRVTQMGAVRSPLLFEQLILSLAPGLPRNLPRKFCLFGVVQQPRPAIWRIQLLPLQLMRIPLETMPTCLSPIPGGCLFANDKGEIRCLNHQGQNHGRFQFGFQAPLGLGAWRGPGKDTTENLLGLGGVTPAANGSCISFIQVKTKTISPMEPPDF